MFEKWRHEDFWRIKGDVAWRGIGWGNVLDAVSDCINDELGKRGLLDALDEPDYTGIERTRVEDVEDIDYVVNALKGFPYIAYRCQSGEWTGVVEGDAHDESCVNSLVCAVGLVLSLGCRDAERFVFIRVRRFLAEKIANALDKVVRGLNRRGEACEPEIQDCCKAFEKALSCKEHRDYVCLCFSSAQHDRVKNLVLRSGIAWRRQIVWEYSNMVENSGKGMLLGEFMNCEYIDNEIKRQEERRIERERVLSMIDAAWADDL